MNRKDWKHYYLKKGKYEDGRERIVIAWYTENGLRKIIALPKPEILKQILAERRDGDGKAKSISKFGGLYKSIYDKKS